MTLLRKTTQHVLPVEKTNGSESGYDIYPVHDIGGGKIHSDYLSLARYLSGHKTVVVDGYVGVRFDVFEREMNKAFTSLGIEPVWWSASAAMKDPGTVQKMVEPFLGGDDPIFGFRTSLELKDFFDTDLLAAIKPDPKAGINIITGTGAALAGWDGPLVYIDIPKNEIQFRARAGSITNIGADRPDDPKKMYKRFYFVDWVVLNRHKKAILPAMDAVVDGQRESEITWASGADVRAGLDSLSKNAFRVRPWFEPGVWGGQWILNNIKELAQDVDNYAWSFELIVPENGVLLSSDKKMLEVSFDTLMYEGGRSVVGDKCYAEYGDEFPIRMDYLDNCDGGNLSIQCHPQRDYIQKNFGEVLTQEETYYILDTCKDDAEVYIGFKEGIDPAEFEHALTESFLGATELDVDRYINSEPSRKHELFLIPPGTVHSSGKGNLVLEISSTPYIFTFKMYDWLALDLDGKPRPLNIKRAMDNLCFDRQGDKVKQELISHPKLLEKGDGWELWHLPTHRNHSYDVHRFNIKTEANVTTEGKCHVLNLVEGEGVDIITKNGKKHHLNYAETIVVSAGAESYRIVNTTPEEIMIVKTFMK